jgi:sulfite reductase (NADPH) flavoprotein alpha-component
MSKDIAIYYVTMTGNSEGLARSTFDKVQAEGWNATLHNLVDVKPADLASNAQNAIFVVSTWGQGEPPDDATEFFNALSDGGQNLSALQHAVFGLGDSNYEQFNAFAIALDAALTKSGSKAVAEVFTSDVVFELSYAKWEKTVLATFAA